MNPQRIAKIDAEQVGLRGLQSFFNVESVATLLSAKHSVPAKDQHFAKLQAESIRFCLQQALEYRSAALASTFARPTLTYYSIMSLALCEILYKRDGRYRLQKLREANAHHGLKLHVQTPARFRRFVGLDDLSVEPLQAGTFAVWQGTAQLQGLIGKESVVTLGGTTTGQRQFASAHTLEPLSTSVSLGQLAQTCPSIYAESNDLQLRSRLARVSIERTHDQRVHTISFQVVIHPTEPSVLEDV